MIIERNYSQFPLPKAPGEIPPLHAMIPYDGHGQKSGDYLQFHPHQSAVRVSAKNTQN